MKFQSIYTSTFKKKLLPFIVCICWSSAVFAFQTNGDAAVSDPQVWKVEVEGNETFSDILIKQNIATESPSFWQKLIFWNRGGHELNETEVLRDVIRIRNYYQRRGFPEVRVSYQIQNGNRSWKRTVRFNIDENAPVIIRSVNYQIDPEHKQYITGSRSFQRSRTEHEFQSGRRYQNISEPDIVGSFNNVLRNLGFAFAEVNVNTQIDTLLYQADITVDINPGPITYFDAINISGMETVSEQYVAREAALEEGERYTQDKLQEAQREVFSHHLFRFATINIPEQPRDSTLAVDINVRENSLRSVQLQAGVGTEDILRGEVSWTHRNVLRRGNRFSVAGRASFIEQSLNIDYLLPYLFNTRSSLVISPFLQHILERRIFELFHGGITNSFIYQYREDLTGTASYQFSRNLELSQESEDVLPDTTFEYNLSSFQLSGYYNPGFSTRGQQGWVIQPYAEFSGVLGGAAFSFQKFSIDVRRFAQLTSSTTFAARVQAGGIFNVAQDSLPQNIRYYLGGTSSVRGWGRNELGPKRVRLDSTDAFSAYGPVGGQAKFGFNAEIRQQLNSFINGFGVVVFLDGGQVWREFGDIGNRPIQFAIGGGLRYNSPIGPIRVDVGYKLNPTDEDLNIYQGTNYGNNFDRIGIHFSIGQAF